MNESTDRTPAVRVNLPSALRAYADDERVVELEGRTVGEVLENLVARYPRLRTHLLDEDGRTRSFVSVYLGDEDIRHLEGSDTVVAQQHELSIVPSIAGGSTD